MCISVSDVIRARDETIRYHATIDRYILLYLSILLKNDNPERKKQMISCVPRTPHLHLF
jgi:hypothetical protein